MRFNQKYFPGWLGAIGCGLVLTLAATSIALGQRSSDAEASLELPAENDSWINTVPVSAEMLKGKAALFYLFEEG